MALLDHEFEAFEGSSGMACTKMVTDSDGFGTDCGRPASQHPKMVCRGCKGEAIGEVDRDPYDVVSGSPIIYPVKYCLSCYNLRVIGALNYVLKAH